MERLMPWEEPCEEPWPLEWPAYAERLRELRTKEARSSLDLELRIMILMELRVRS